MHRRINSITKTSIDETSRVDGKKNAWVNENVILTKCMSLK